MTKSNHMHAADEHQSETGQRDLAAGVLKQVDAGPATVP